MKTANIAYSSMPQYEDKMKTILTKLVLMYFANMQKYQCILHQKHI